MTKLSEEHQYIDFKLLAQHDDFKVDSFGLILNKNLNFVSNLFFRSHLFKRDNLRRTAKPEKRRTTFL